MAMTKHEDFFDLTRTRHATIYDGVEMVWEAVGRIDEYIRENLEPGIFGRVKTGAHIGGDVYIGPGTVVEPGATIRGPSIIGAHCEIRAGAFIRGNVIIGDGCVVGNSSEIKNALLHDEAAAPHFAYIGDALLGWRVHLGAGVKLSNVRFDGKSVVVNPGDAMYDTHMKKFAAAIGDLVEIGCNAVLNPGSLIGPRSVLYPGVVWSGSLAPDSIVKLRQQHQIVERIERD